VRARLHISSAGAIITALLLQAGPARALQPLGEFLAGARRASVDDREVAVSAEELETEALIALGRNLPALSVRGQYTRNQYEVAFNVPANLMLPGLQIPQGPIQPFNQWDAYFQLDIPIIDVAAWARTYVAQRTAHAGRFNAQATFLNVEKQVARDYYQLIGAAALRLSAERALAAAEANHRLTVERRGAGVATQLDVARAAADVERARQNVADAELLIALTRRALLTRTGVDATADSSATNDDLRPEADLGTWEATRDEDIPALAAAAEQARVATTGARAAKYALLPTLSLTGLERVTNATGFLLGNNSAYTVTMTLAWRLDVATIASIKAAAQQAEIARLRAERTRLGVRDQIHDDWQRVRAGIVKSRAARAQAEAALLAAQYANERYGSGAGTQLDVIQAQRDAYAAEVARIQADADLRFSRALLRLDAGRPLDGEHDR
jgi:outer membrane protein TolC